MSSKLELKIVADSGNNNIELDNMSLHTGKAFKTLIDSLIQIVELTPGNDQIRLEITTGSAVVAAYGPDERINTIREEFDAIATYESTREDLIKPWRDIQEVIRANGLSYQARFVSGIEASHDAAPVAPIDITPNLLTQRRFRVKSVRQTPLVYVSFHSGKLTTIGGQNPNFHVELPAGEGNIKVACSEPEAQRVNSFLYNTLFFSAWRMMVDNDVKGYRYCDVYISEQQFIMIKGLFEQIVNADPLTMLNNIHRVTRNLIVHGEFQMLAKLMRLYCQKGIDINVLKTMLVITKGIRDHESIADIRQRIEGLLESEVELY